MQNRRIQFSMREYADRLLRETDKITADNIGEQTINVRKGSCDRVSWIAEQIRQAIRLHDYGSLQSIRASLMWVEDSPDDPRPYKRTRT